ncbi:MAG: DUF3084 domain-containing protein [Armatimonadota bacterium]|nr:DUF3084 domain-containing protein [bacterium]MCS7308744.1 DUF3084 domain-containing protein [Armatimonadota bacterium]MDW8103498.1 DUF3084 domain-containing protein [Armatimonadota bacterium]MDW8289290.1 DUF3084 domain-containing protein [Armatimonadota bacterium]
MPVRTILIGIIFIVVSGFIAYFGDWLGRYLGKRRISIWGLRPRHTAMLITSFTGSLIAFLTIVAVLATAQTFREIIVRGERLLEQSRQLQVRYAQLRGDYDQLQQRYQEAAQRIREQQKQMAENTRQLQRQQQLLEAVRLQLEQRQRQVAELSGRIVQQSQQLQRLQKQNVLLQTSNRQLSQTNAQLKRQGQFLREQNRLYQQNNADLASQNMEYARENVQLNNQNAQLQQQAAQLRQQTEQLSQQSRQLQQQADALRATIEQLQMREAELRELVEQLEQIKEKPIVARRGEEIARRVIPNGMSLRATRNEIYRLLVEAGRLAQERGAAARGAHRAAYIPLKRLSVPSPTGGSVEVFADEAVSVEALAEQIARSDTPVVVLAVAVRNGVAGEPIQVELKPFRNRLVYRKDEEIARARIWSGRGTGEIANTLIEFLRDEVRARAIEAGIIPRIGADGEPVVGAVPNQQITDLAERIAREGRGRYVNVAALAETDTYSADSLRLRFRVVQ